MARTGRTALDVLRVRVDGGEYALPLDHVVEVVHAVAVTPLPKSPHLIKGLVNLRGELVPLLDLGQRLGLAPRAGALTDCFVICRVGCRRIAVRVESADAVSTLPASERHGALPRSAGENLCDAVRLPDGALLVLDVCSFLAAEEALRLDEALNEHRAEIPW